MERYDAAQVELHASEQRFVEQMTGRFISRRVTPAELRQHLEAIRERWRDSGRPDHDIVLAFIEDMVNEATILVQSRHAH